MTSREPDPVGRGDLADVRASMRAELRAERRASEAEAIRDQWCRRDMVTVLHETMRRGDTVILECHPRRLQGQVVDAGRDYAVVATGRDRVAVRAGDVDAEGQAGSYTGPPLVVRVAQRARHGGTHAADPAATFRSVLQRLDFEAQVDPSAQVELGVGLLSEPLVGHVSALAADHLYLCDLDGVEAFVALSTVTYVTRR